MPMLTTDKTSCYILSELLSAHGVKQAVISPGSRNTPIVLALDANDNIKKHVVIDERSAAFIALGIAVATNAPVAIICTSGTAMLNYAPAVAEAYYQGVPLIVISADRPMQWIDQDDSQTLRQFEALGNFVKKSYDIPDFVASDEEMCWYANRVINDALITANDNRKGPVHINIQLNQPLSRRIQRSEQQRIISSVPTIKEIPSEVLSPLLEAIADKNILIVVGFMPANGNLQRMMVEMSAYSNVIILTETISNIAGDGIISTIDRVLSVADKEELENISPEVVISFGGALVSRFIKQYLRDQKPKRHLSIGFNHTTVDCFKSLTDRVEVAPEYFLDLLNKHISNSSTINSNFRDNWLKLNDKATRSHERFIGKCQWSDLKAFSIIANSFKSSDVNLCLSNGTPIRYIQLFDNIKFNSCSCNRGVSGIDGCTSTAIGIATGNHNDECQTILITGDMSFSYDVGALATKFIPDNFKIIILNNSGGGIFRFIPSTADLPQLEKYFAVTPMLPIPELATAYGFDYYKASNEGELSQTMSQFMISSKKSILEIITPPDVSGKILRDYMSRK